MEKNYQVLFTPAKIGECELKNRFVMCPMEGTSMIDWIKGKGFNPEVHDLYIERAKDGIGLMIPGAVPVRGLVNRKWLYKNPKAFDGVSELMDEIHSYGSKVFFQLSVGFGRNFTFSRKMADHYGLMKLLLKIDRTAASSDAGLPNRWVPEIKTRQLTVDEIHEYVHAMAETAYLCKLNGVDGIDVHAVHEGYLFDQFTLPYTNHRKDEYGGSLENRLRFACEIVQAIKKRCGQDYPVILRYSVTSRTKNFGEGIIPADTESVEIGRTFEESKEAIRILSEAGYDAFNADNGTYDAWYYAHPPVYMPLNCNLSDVTAVKPYTNKPVICAGRMQLDEASAAIRAGNLDFVGIGRQFLADPEYLTKIQGDRLEDIIPCISCHIGCMPIGMYKGTGCIIPKETGRCALNPHTNAEKIYVNKPADQIKNIAVIGGGIAGMEFAVRSTMRGHHVEIYEKSKRLGGVFNEAAAFTFKEKDRDLITYYKTQVMKLNIPVHYNSEIQNLNDVKADEYVIATGAAGPRQLSVTGSQNSIAAVDFISGGLKCGDEIVIIGGGLTGCEIAYELAMRGKKISIVEMADDILKVPGSSMANTSYLRDAFKYYGVDIYTSAKTLSMTENTVTIETETGQQLTIHSTDIITSIGYLKESRFEENQNVHLIGDASNISNLKNAI